MNANLQKMAEVADSLYSLLITLRMDNIPPETHLKVLQEGLSKNQKLLVAAIIAETGQNPWDRPEHLTLYSK